MHLRAGGLLRLFFLCFALTSLSAAPAFSQPAASGMRFSLEQICESGACEILLIADGVIERDSDEKLLKTLGSLPGGITVELNSPGGDLQGGLRLGDAIRAKRLHTRVRYAYPAGAKTAKDFRPAVCYSACALAFLGGVNRSLDDRAQYGVHGLQRSDSQQAPNPSGELNKLNFWGIFGKGAAPGAASPKNPAGPPSGSPGPSSAQRAETDRRVANALGSYVDQMGVDRKLIDIILTAAPGQLSAIDVEAAKRLNIDNRGRSTQASWRLQATSKGDLVSTVTERQRNGNFSLTLGLARVEGDLRLLIHLRPSAELSAGALQSLERALQNAPNPRIESKGGSMTLAPLRPWAAAKEGFQLWVRISEAELTALTQQFEFSLLLELPAAAGVDQSTGFSTAGLRNFLAAIKRN